MALEKAQRWGSERIILRYWDMGIKTGDESLIALKAEL